MRPRALLRPPSEAYARCLRPDPGAPIDLARARAQHAAYAAALGEFADVELLSPEPDMPDACFVEDAAIVNGRVAVITRPGAEARRAETPGVARALARTHDCRPMRIGRLDGGDVMLAGGRAFVGLSARTDREGASELGRLLGLETVLVPLGPWLHLKTAVTPIGPDALLQLKGAYPAGAFPGFAIVETDEPMGANVLALAGGVLVSAAAPRTAALLAARGLRARSVEIGEFHAGDAGLTCLSLIL